MPARTIFTIRGINLYNLPNELVISYLDSYILTNEVSHVARLVNKSFDYAEFETLSSERYDNINTWEYFGQPFNLPRELYEVEFI